ncbi:family 16 glycoside hydrolase [Gimesia aquarii]|uniref:HEAT repeat protein n=1 Tax=Gimesia aquarii TaxID=2527964 RepID=A0A517VPC2_9PLAN|nr:family 16 glycoside hydrolase [Gimesia aquarii]QDT94868.1 HEAT repeat protein [Gimesia aquarii]
MFALKYPVILLLSFSLLLNVTPANADTKNDSKKETARLVKVLNSDADTHTKAMACRRLAAIGHKSAITSLANYLGNPKLATYTRSALENIPDQGADDALRNALTEVKGNLLVGVINSIGKRKDKKATGDLTKLLSDKNTKIAIAAAHALGSIGTKSAADALQAAIGKGDKKLQREVGFACLMCARSLAKKGDKQTAIALTELVHKADLPKNIKVAAMQLTIVLKGKAGLGLLAEELKSEDLSRFRSGLQAARDLGKQSTSTLINVFNALPDERKALVIPALSLSHDSTALPLIRKAATTGSEPLKLQAVYALSELEPALDENAQLQVLKDLFGLLKQNNSEIVSAAQAVITQISSSQPPEKVKALIESNTRKLVESEGLPQQLMGLQLAGACRIDSVTPTLLSLASHSNTEVKQAAIKALGGTTSAATLSQLITLALKNPNDKTTSDALKAACSRLPLDQTAQALASAMQGATTEQKQLLLKQLAAIGGETALKTIVKAARSNNDALQNTATDLLGKWVSIDVAPALLDLAKNLENRKYKIRSLRGYIRVARQLNMTPEQRLEVCRNTLANAERNDERKLVFEVLRRYPNPLAVNYTVSLLKDKQLNVPASSIIVSWAERGTPVDADLLQNALQQVIATTSNANLKKRATQQLERVRVQAEQDEQAAGFQSLFDGKSFDGWHGNEKIFRIEDGEIVGGSLTEKVERNEFLRSNKEYDDFELKLEFKLLGDKTNAGVQIRTAEIPDHHEVIGYQADLGTGYWGCLYDESRRKKILAGPPKDQRTFPIRMDDWNTYRIRCEGPRIQLWINGVQTVDFTEDDPKIPLKGIIALQIHGNLVNQVHYRNIRLREL